MDYLDELFNDPRVREIMNRTKTKERARCGKMQGKIARYAKGEAHVQEVVEVRRHLAFCERCLRKAIAGGYG